MRGGGCIALLSLSSDFLFSFYYSAQFLLLLYNLKVRFYRESFRSFKAEQMFSITSQSDYWITFLHLKGKRRDHLSYWMELSLIDWTHDEQQHKVGLRCAHCRLGGDGFISLSGGPKYQRFSRCLRYPRCLR